MHKSISRSKKFIPLSTWLREGKTFHSLSLLEEVKHRIETYNSEQSGSENSSESVQRVSLPSLSLPQTQTSNQQRAEMQNFRRLFAPYVAGASPCRPPQWPSPAATRRKGTAGISSSRGAGGASLVQLSKFYSVCSISVVFLLAKNLIFITEDDPIGVWLISSHFKFMMST